MIINRETLPINFTCNMHGMPRWKLLDDLSPRFAQSRRFVYPASGGVLHRAIHRDDFAALE